MNYTEIDDDFKLELAGLKAYLFGGLGKPPRSYGEVVRDVLCERYDIDIEKYLIVVSQDFADRFDLKPIECNDDLKISPHIKEYIIAVKRSLY